MALRIGFMGTPDFALEALKALVASEHEIVCVYSQPPRPKGRGHKLTPSPVQAYAEEQNIPVFHPTSLKSQDIQAQFAAHNLDVAIVAAYGLLLPEAILNAPKYGCLNIHGSILPRWRGASPIQHAIWKGDSETGVTIMQMDKGLDTGDMIAINSIKIADTDTSATLHDKLSEMGARMAVEVLQNLDKNGQLPKEKQKNELSTYAPLLKKSDGEIDWSMSAGEIERQIRALNPWPGVVSNIKDVRFKILEAVPVSAIEKDVQAGTLIDKTGHVVCGTGTTLQLKRIQPLGKKPMDVASALNGGYLTIGDVFI